MKNLMTALLLALAITQQACQAQDTPENNPPPTPPPATEPAPQPAPPADQAPPPEPQPAPQETPPPVPPPAEPATPPTPEPAPLPPAPEPATPPPAPEPAETIPVPAPEPAEALPGVEPITVQAREVEGAGGADATNAVSVEAAGAPVAEVVPLIVIDDVPLTDAIRNLARQSNLNFQFDPRVSATNQPNISIRFENVTAEEALQAVLDNYNLALSRDSRSRIARVTIKDPKAEEPLISQVVQLKYSDPTNMITLVKSTLSGRSQVMADPRTSQIIIATTAKEMDGAVKLIERLDSPTKQVLIEARLYETSRKPSTIRGVDWSGTFEAQRVNFGNNTGDSSGSPNKNDVLVGSPVGKLLLDTSRGFNPATAFLDADGVSAVISFLNKDIDSEVVATPRAVTLDNQAAHLSVTRAFPIFKVTPGSANSPAGAEITYTNLGTILTVTPRIAADNNISLRVIPEVSNVDGQDVQVLNGQRNVANIYAIRRIETHVMIPSGNTLVLGGLITDRRTKEYNKVPVLGDIPGVGAAFRKESKSRDKANLLIFITPTIVAESDYHPNHEGPEFLASKYTPPPDGKESAWDSAKPYDWTKPLRRK